MPDRSTDQECRICGIQPAHRGQTFELAEYPGECTVTEIPLCAGCRARCGVIQMRRELPVIVDSSGTHRPPYAARADRAARSVLAAAGVFEICGACHRQGTGCCPPTCRVMGRNGCDPDNRYGKTIFARPSSAAPCSTPSRRSTRRPAYAALDRGQIGPTEYHIYEMITRVPAAARNRNDQSACPLPIQFHHSMVAGERIRASLISMSDEILEIRRNW
jgi:hypothetical protein